MVFDDQAQSPPAEPRQAFDDSADGAFKRALGYQDAAIVPATRQSKSGGVNTKNAKYRKGAKAGCGSK